MSGANPIDNNPSTLNAMAFAGAVSETFTKKGDDKKLLTGVAARKIDSVVISKLEKKVDILQHMAEQSKDTNVIEGFNEVMMELASTGDISRRTKFTNIIAEIAEENRSAFNSIFILINNMERMGLGGYAPSYVDELNWTYTRLGMKGLNSLNNELRAVLNADYTKSQVSAPGNLSSFFKVYNALFSAGTQNPGTEGYLSQFDRNIAAQMNADAIKNYLTCFLNKFLPRIKNRH